MAQVQGGVYHVGLPPQQQQPQGMQQQEQGQPVKCKAFDCGFNSSPEYGGYCHGCFLMTTKHQAEKDKGIMNFLLFIIYFIDIVLSSKIASSVIINCYQWGSCLLYETLSK